MRPQPLALEPLRARLPDFWWSEVSRIRELIAQDAGRQLKATALAQRRKAS